MEGHAAVTSSCTPDPAEQSVPMGHGAMPDPTPGLPGGLARETIRTKPAERFHSPVLGTLVAFSVPCILISLKSIKYVNNDNEMKLQV